MNSGSNDHPSDPPLSARRRQLLPLTSSHPEYPTPHAVPSVSIRALPLRGHAGRVRRRPGPEATTRGQAARGARLRCADGVLDLVDPALDAILERHRDRAHEIGNDVVERGPDAVTRATRRGSGRRSRLHVGTRAAEQYADTHCRRERRPRMIPYELHHIQLVLQLRERARHPLSRQLDVAPDVSCRFSHSLSSLSVATVSSGISSLGESAFLPRIISQAAMPPVSTTT